jgi:hypothetical protein
MNVEKLLLIKANKFRIVPLALIQLGMAYLVLQKEIATIFVRPFQKISAYLAIIVVVLVVRLVIK